MPNTLFDNRFLSSARLQTIIEVAASELERMRPLTFLDRLTLVNAVDDELMGRFTARLFAADIIADGQKALVYDGGQIEVSTTQIPNIKIGNNLNQTTLNLLQRLDEGLGRAVDEDAAYDWFRSFGENLVAGVRERMNAMACAMMLDSYSYDRWGVKLSGATWGMPSNLKVTTSPAWSSDGGTTANASAMPLTDIWNLDKVDADNYGMGPFDRITMGSKAFDFLTQTTEFANRSWVILGAAFLPTSAAVPNLSRAENQRVLERVLQKTVVIDDKTFREQAGSGAQSSTRVLPLNKVLLDRTTNGPREWDFGNGVVTESVVSEMVGAGTLGTNPRMTVGGAYGPLGYFTPQAPDLNPPGVNGWAVCRGFPRKKVVESSAVLTIW